MQLWLPEVDGPVDLSNPTHLALLMLLGAHARTITLRLPKPDSEALVPDLVSLNRLFTAWTETIYHRTVHSETGLTPLDRWQAGDLPKLPTASALREAFLWEATRAVTKTATVSLHGNVYQVDGGLVGRRVELVFDPFDLTTASASSSAATTPEQRQWEKLLGRLGLRSGEVAALQLRDIDWRAGEIWVRGKARRESRLPLTVDVGEALADYLREGRPSSQCPNVILTSYAPFRGIRPSSITRVVYRACRRVGLPLVGGHRLRHALATEMLRQGSNLVEISQVLRHRDLATTSVYAKLDLTALRTVARPWPGALR